uniref:Uncharacterized protein n=1 Tax=Triticum urartu TaxID=4572 RepID=A0A8R7TBC6_TRIUA
MLSIKNNTQAGLVFFHLLRSRLSKEQFSAVGFCVFEVLQLPRAIGSRNYSQACRL